ncbi:hypothetical protein ACOSQ2_031581 [Xanthoceras sorbifolium]
MKLSLLHSLRGGGSLPPRMEANLLHRQRTLSDQRLHEADTGGSPDTRDLEYEQFASRERTKYQGNRATTTHRSEVTGSSTSGRMEVRSDQEEFVEVFTSKGHDESEGADDPSLAIPKGLQT